MTLDARRIALQGIGAGALALAVQGFTPVPLPTRPPIHHAAVGGSVVTGPSESVDDLLRRLKRAEKAPAADAIVARRRAEEDLLLMLEVIG